MNFTKKESELSKLRKMKNNPKNYLEKELIEFRKKEEKENKEKKEMNRWNKIFYYHDKNQFKGEINYRNNYKDEWENIEENEDFLW